MNKKLRQVVAIIALVLMAGFLASLMAYLIDSTLLNGGIMYLAIFTGGFAFALYLVILFDNKFGPEGMKKRIEQAEKEEEEARKKYEEEHKETAEDENSESPARSEVDPPVESDPTDFSASESSAEPTQDGDSEQ